MFLMLLKIVIRAVGNAFEFLHAERKFVLNVVRALGIMRPLVGGYIKHLQLFA